MEDWQAESNRIMKVSHILSVVTSVSLLLVSSPALAVTRIVFPKGAYCGSAKVSQAYNQAFVVAVGRANQALTVHGNDVDTTNIRSSEGWYYNNGNEAGLITSSEKDYTIFVPRGAVFSPSAVIDVCIH